MPIPPFFIAVWGYRDAEIPAPALSNFTSWLQKSPGWGGAIYRPDTILSMAHTLPDDVRDMVVPLLQCKPSAKVAWIQQADMARVVAVWYVGGVYLDMLDSIVVKPLDELISADLLVSQGPPAAPLEADFLGASAGDPRLLQLLKLQSTRVQTYKPSNFPSHLVMMTTGPKAWEKWATDVGVEALPLTKRYFREKRGKAEPVWKCGLDVEGPYVVVHHASSWMSKWKPLDHVVAPPKTRAPLKVRKTFNKLPSGSSQPVSRGAGTSLSSVLTAKAQGIVQTADSKLSLAREAGCFQLVDFPNVSIAEASNADEKNRRALLTRVLTMHCPEQRREKLLEALGANAQLRRKASIVLADSGGDPTFKALVSFMAGKGRGCKKKV